MALKAQLTDCVEEVAKKWFDRTIPLDIVVSPTLPDSWVEIAWNVEQEVSTKPLNPRWFSWPFTKPLSNGSSSLAAGIKPYVLPVGLSVSAILTYASMVSIGWLSNSQSVQQFQSAARNSVQHQSIFAIDQLEQIRILLGDQSEAPKMKTKTIEYIANAVRQGDGLINSLVVYDAESEEDFDAQLTVSIRSNGLSILEQGKKSSAQLANYLGANVVVRAYRERSSSVHGAKTTYRVYTMTIKLIEKEVV